MSAELDALSWLTGDALKPLWANARRRLEGNGLSVRGSLILPISGPAERQAFSGLLGRSLTGDRARIDLDELDRRLRASAARVGLISVLEHVGGPLTNRRAARAVASERRTALWSAVDDALADHGLSDERWIGDWLSELRAAGTLTRLGERASATACTAIACLAAVLGPQRDLPVARGVLAQRIAGSAHALDDAAILGRIVIKALAGAYEQPAPRSAAQRRALWQTAGVTPDQVSTTVLTSGLRPTGNEWADLVHRRSDLGAETHLSTRDINRVHWELPAGTIVSMCENPRVVEEALIRGSRGPLICTLGNPTVVVTEFLSRLRATRTEVRYHGDFDWPGVAIAARVIAMGCDPWRMGATDYEDAVSRAAPLVGDLPELTGSPVDTPWDSELRQSMLRLGRAVHEEALLDILLDDVG